MRTRTVLLLSVLLFALVLGYLYLTQTHQGRLFGLYAVAGIRAPGEVRTDCRAQTYARVAEKFSNPLTMSDDAREGLAEYWHYSFYRNCLYNRGYGFTGVTLPRATLAVDVGGVTYTNPFGGITLSLLPGTTLDRDNVLDVTYDYRLLRSSLVRGTTTVVLDVYVSDERITSFEDLEQNLAHIHTTQASTTQVAVRTTAAGTRYLAVDDGVYCGGVLMTPHKHIIDLYALCSTESYVETLIESVRFTQTSTSLY